MSEWIKFSEQKPLSFKDIIVAYKIIHSKIQVKVAWVENEPDEDLQLFVDNTFLLGSDDEERKLLAWMPMPEYKDE